MEYVLSLLAVSLAPIVVLFTIVFMLDRYEREPLSILILCFVLGIVIALPVIYAERGLKALFGLQDESMDLMQTALIAFVVVALVEEGFKFLVLRFYAYPRQAFNEPYDGIMYAMAVSMGFAAIENVLYVWSGGMTIGILRAFTAVPGHGVFAHFMGYFAGLGKFATPTWKRWGLLSLGLFLAVVTHGFYDFFLMQQYQSYLAFFAFGVLAIALVLAFRAIRAHRRRSPFKNRAA